MTAKETKNSIFLFSGFLLLLWIGIHNYTQDLLHSYQILWAFSIILVCFFILIKKHYKTFLWIFISFFIGIIIWYNHQLHIDTRLDYLSDHYYEKQNLTFKIDGVYKKTDFTVEYKAALISIDKNPVLENIYVILKVPKNYTLESSQIYSSYTKILPITNIGAFEYKSFMLSKDVYATVYINAIDQVPGEEQWYFLKNLESLREKILWDIFLIFPKNEAIFLWGILIGARENIPQTLKDNFNNSGLTHFIAVSWFNITILILFFWFLTQYFPIPLRILSMAVFILLFTLLVGESAPVVRASIMGIVWYMVLHSGRQVHSLSIILLTAIIMVIYSPLALNYDVSLHLSFLAVLWIIYTQKFFEKIFYWVPNILEIRTAVVLTFSALCFALPVMIFNFGQVSIIAPLANLLVTWTIPIAMFLGFITIIVYWFFPFIWHIIGYFAWIFLKWDMLVVEYFWEMQWSVLQTDFWFYRYYYEIIYFLILIFIIFWFKKKEATQ